MSTSIGDVAARAGVSVATVSRALRGLPNVAAETRDRVLHAATELDYVVNPNASRLAAGHNRAIGVVVSQLAGGYVQHVLAGVQGVLGDAGYDMLLYAADPQQARERFLAQLPFRKRVDGLVLIGVPLGEAEQEMLARLGIPLVGVGEGGRHFPLVRIDDRRGARLATDYLLDLGHRRVGLLCGPLDDPLHHRVARDRQAGWADALHHRALPAEERQIAVGPITMAGGGDAMARLLSRTPGLTAVVCMCDEMAIGAMEVLAEQRIRLPDQLSLVGFDDLPVSRHIGLTTVRQPMAELGLRAAELLIGELLGDPRRHRARVLPVAVVPRATTAPLQ